VDTATAVASGYCAVAPGSPPRKREGLHASVPVKARKRLVTKCDIDGMTSGLLLKELDLVDGVLFCQARDIETAAVRITENDITAGLPCRESACLAFDHYRNTGAAGGHVVVDTAMLSTSRVIYNHFGAQRLRRIPGELLQVVDKVISAEVTLDDILYPSGWMLLAQLIDQRTGLDRYARFTMSNAGLIEALMEWCRDATVWELLSLPPVEERNACYFGCVEAYKAQLLRCASVHKNLVVVDLRREATIYPGNRFMLYALFPECNVSLQIMRHHAGAGTCFVAGKSFLDRSLDLDIGSIMKRHGGDGHRNAGACEVAREQADAVADSLIRSLRYGALKNLLMGYYNYYYP